MLRYLAYWKARESLAGPTWWVVSKTLTQMAVSWSIFFVLIPFLIKSTERSWGFDVWNEFPVLPLIALTVFTLAGSVGVASSMVMAVYGGGTPLPTDCAPRLTIRGPYRYVRNPMAMSGILQGAASGLYFGSPTVVLAAVLAGPIWNILVRPWEERDLEQRFGLQYRQYRNAVMCWIPRLSPYRPEP